MLKSVWRRQYIVKEIYDTACATRAWGNTYLQEVSNLCSMQAFHMVQPAKCTSMSSILKQSKYKYNKFFMDRIMPPKPSIETKTYNQECWESRIASLLDRWSVDGSWWLSQGPNLSLLGRGSIDRPSQTTRSRISFCSS